MEEDKVNSKCSEHTGPILYRADDTTKSEEYQKLKEEIKQQDREPFINRLIESYADPANAKQDIHMNIIKRLCIVLSYESLNENQFLKLVLVIALHVSKDAHKYPGIAALARILSAAVFKKDDFDLASNGFFPVLSEFLPDEITDCISTKVEKIKLKTTKKYAGTIYENAEYVKNDISFMEKKYNPHFIQEAYQMLQEKNSQEEILAAHMNFANILDRTSEWLLDAFSDQIFEELTRLSTPALYDHQSASLAAFVFKRTAFCDKLIDMFFCTDFETMQLFILSTLGILHDKFDLENKVAHQVKFIERFLETEKEYSNVIKQEIKDYVECGMKLINMQ
ncbi:hypothetical protein ENBRE01_0109 [Enteropsectra breve]|nr:hypothetical protein ENBRE01_0109 [Enteropsectra breve]